MSNDPIIREVQNEFSTFVVEEAVWPENKEPTEEPIELHCDDAENLYVWSIRILADLEANPTEAKINTYENALQRVYRERFRQARKSCRNYKGTKGNKKCIHAVWLDTYDKIQEIKNSQMPVVFKEEAEVRYLEPQVRPITGAPIGLFPKVSARELEDSNAQN